MNRKKFNAILMSYVLTAISFICLVSNIWNYNSITNLSYGSLIFSAIVLFLNLLLYGYTIEIDGEWDTSVKPIQRPQVIAEPVAWPLTISFLIFICQALTLQF